MRHDAKKDVTNGDKYITKLLNRELLRYVMIIPVHTRDVLENVRMSRCAHCDVTTL